MATEPDNWVLQLLCEIRAKLDEHSHAHAEHRQSFKEIRDEMKLANQNSAYAAGFAVLGRRDNEVTGARVTDLEGRVKRLEERLES